MTKMQVTSNEREGFERIFCHSLIRYILITSIFFLTSKQINFQSTKSIKIYFINKRNTKLYIGNIWSWCI